MDKSPGDSLIFEHSALRGISYALTMERRSTQATLEALLERWGQEGLPDYAQFDNHTIFQEPHHFPDAVRRISRLGLALKVTPVFAPPREPGFQNAIEGVNALCRPRSDSAITAPTSRP